MNDRTRGGATDRAAARRRRLWGHRTLAIGFSVGVHLAILLAFISTRIDTPPVMDLAPVEVSMIEFPAPQSPAPAKVAAPKVTKRIKIAKPLPKPPRRPTPVVRTKVEPIPAGENAKAPSNELSEAQIAGATTAGSGGGSGGGRCDMVHYLQSELRKDRAVQAAAANAHRGNAMRVWDGDWLVSSGEEGKGLAIVREAIMVEVAFAPEACKREPVRGIVLISLSDGPGSARLALGSGSWRWQDMLFAPGTRRN